MNHSTATTEHLKEYNPNEQQDLETSSEPVDLSGQQIVRIKISKPYQKTVGDTQPFAENADETISDDVWRFGDLWTVPKECENQGSGDPDHKFYVHPFVNDDRTDEELEEEILRMALADGAVDKGFRK